MSNEHYKDLFLQAADDRLCDYYSLDARYIVRKEGGQSRLSEGLIVLVPLPVIHDMSFKVDTSLLSAGQQQLSRVSKKKLLQFLHHATQGQVDANGESFCLSSEQPFSYYSEMTHSDRWFSDLHLQVSGVMQAVPSPIDSTVIDNELRNGTPPFDGLVDIKQWLGMSNPQSTQDTGSITIRVGPPVDLVLTACGLKDDQLRLTLHAHPRFDTSRLSLAVRATPGNTLESRRQVATEIEWERPRNGLRKGTALIRLTQADSAFAMLMIGGATVRRQWFLDPAKARNNRLVAVQHFDKDLKMVKLALESTDSNRFELGVASLLFLLGFTPTVQIETDSPDLVVATPAGRLVIVECTTKFADFSSKLGKLVDRRGALSKALQASGHYSQVVGILVCGLPKDQIAPQANELATHQVPLVTKEDLTKAFELLRFPSDPDEMLDKAMAHLNAGSQAPFG
ncbi:MAG: hypothetical protein ACLPXB_10115 [Thiobacillaceae bacterium]